jgi:hypothetical protein
MGIRWTSEWSWQPAECSDLAHSNGNRRGVVVTVTRREPRINGAVGWHVLFKQSRPSGTQWQ